MVNLTLLQSLCPGTKIVVLSQYAPALNEVMDYYDINSKHRIAGFLAQVIHESSGFNTVKENLNYSAVGLRKTFGKYFPTIELANQYARKPEMIANRVYANRMKNGDEASGDGYRFCGRGLIQITGRENYTKLAEALDMSREECVSYLETPEGACASAGWFWDTNQLNDYCDSGDFIMLTKRINGGTNGLEDRRRYYDLAISLLNTL
jgi:putative chitinase